MSSHLSAWHDTAEGRRMAAADSGQQDWRAWGPYLSERAWGTVREDYSEDGSAWDYFPHDHARSRAYRWNEDGLAGLCDANQVFWFPVNYLLIDALHRYARFFGDDILIEHPAGSGRKVTLAVLAGDLARRLVSIFLDDTRGRRPVFGDAGLFQTRPDWHDMLPFHEYFHGDTGRGVGASHQTGWTALVADLIIRTAGRDAGPPLG